MKISLSARKQEHLPIESWVSHMWSHAKIHSNFEFGWDDIDYIFGRTEELTTLWGGRVSDSSNLSRMDVYNIYDRGVGIKLTLQSLFLTDDSYNESKFLLKQYHRKGNSIIVANEKLAERIKNDYPDYKIEASAIFDITTKEKLQQKIDSKLYDTIVLPICMNDDVDFLNDIKDKEQIRLFMNAECSYTCPKKICYGSISRINQGKVVPDEMKCSHYNLNMPRTKYDDSIDWNNFYFDKKEFDRIGFKNYKLVPPWANQQRTNIMYKDPQNCGFALG